MKKIPSLALLSLLLIFSGCLSETAKKQREIEQRVQDSLRLIEVAQRQRADSLRKIEQFKADSIQKVQHLQEVKKSIKILNYYLDAPNSAGGVSAHFRYKNMNDKTIKYLTWEGYPINAVGDPVTCSIRGYSSFRGKDTGPIKKGQSSGYEYWDCAWYNYQAKKLILTKVDIEYMDGSTYSIEGDDLYIIGKKQD